MYRLLLALFTALLAAACYEPPTPACSFYCGADDACPEDYRCATDGWCKRTDVADDFDCGGPAPQPPDAAQPDAPADDAMPADAALPDAAPDANDEALR